MTKDKAEKILRDSYVDSIKECLFVLEAIQQSFDPVPECVNDTIKIVNWVWDNMFKD